MDDDDRASERATDLHRRIASIVSYRLSTDCRLFIIFVGSRLSYLQGPSPSDPRRLSLLLGPDPHHSRPKRVIRDQNELAPVRRVTLLVEKGLSHSLSFLGDQLPDLREGHPPLDLHWRASRLIWRRTERLISDPVAKAGGHLVILRPSRPNRSMICAICRRRTVLSSERGPTFIFPSAPVWTVMVASLGSQGPLPW